MIMMMTGWMILIGDDNGQRVVRGFAKSRIAGELGVWSVCDEYVHGRVLWWVILGGIVNLGEGVALDLCGV